MSLAMFVNNAPSEGPRAQKPLGRKAYGSIPHFPGSRVGPGDYHLQPEQGDLLTKATRDEADRVIVTEKLDGACVAVAMQNGQILPLIRAGYKVADSPYLHLQLFAVWVERRRDLFRALLREGDRVVGEWLLLAHGTRYEIGRADDLFVPFDLFVPTPEPRYPDRRLCHAPFDKRIRDAGMRPAKVLSNGPALSVEDALHRLGPKGHHGALDPAEGAVWRMERNGQVEFLAKYVIHTKSDGHLLPDVSGEPPVWNWSAEDL